MGLNYDHDKHFHLPLIIMKEQANIFRPFYTWLTEEMFARQDAEPQRIIEQRYMGASTENKFYRPK